jgi:hypothetical protein
MNVIMLTMALVVLGSAHASAQERPETPGLATITDISSWKLIHATAENAEVDGKHGVRLIAEGDSANGIVGLALPTGSRFTSGTIEIDLKGAGAGQKRFLGVAFNVAGEKSFEAVYFRPFNFEAEEPMRSRSVQYVAWPVNTWEHLRKTAPGRFESHVDPVPKPDSWFHARIEITDSQVRVYVNESKAPSLVSRRLVSGGHGRPAGLFVDSKDGVYANLRITPRD